LLNSPEQLAPLRAGHQGCCVVAPHQAALPVVALGRLTKQAGISFAFMHLYLPDLFACRSEIFSALLDVFLSRPNLLS
jgi:hypothetical protein